jgi:hypothetical protein
MFPRGRKQYFRREWLVQIMVFLQSVNFYRGQINVENQFASALGTILQHFWDGLAWVSRIHRSISTIRANMVKKCTAIRTDEIDPRSWSWAPYCHPFAPTDPLDRIEGIARYCHSTFLVWVTTAIISWLTIPVLQPLRIRTGLFLECIVWRSIPCVPVSF